MRSITARRFPFVAAATSALAFLAAACGGGGDDENLILTPVTARYLPQVISSDLAVGPNRFLVGLIDQEQNSPVIGAQLHFRFLKLDGGQAAAPIEADAQALRITKSYTHTHQDGTTETHEAGETGAYVANVEFDEAGDWGVQVSGAVEGQQIVPVTPTFSVREESLSPAVGDPAPRSVQTILTDVQDISEIDTSDPPNPDMHDMTIGDAVTSGRPTIIVFATPAFCVSQICGPTKDIVDDLFGRYRGQANFVHVEPYFLEEARSGKGLCAVPVFNLEGARDRWGGSGCPLLSEDELPPPDQSWDLQSEPWVFLVDSQGNIAAKFEAIVAPEEIESVLEPLLATTSADGGYGY